MKIKLKEIHEHLIRFTYINNALHFLTDVCERSNSKYGSTILIRYASIELVNFIDHYNSFLGLLSKKEKTLILDLNSFIEEIFKNKDELKKIRNKWVAHIMNRGNFIKELSKPVKHIDIQEYIVMINGLDLFINGLHAILVKESQYVANNFSKSEDKSLKKHTLNNTSLEMIINTKITTVQAKLDIHDFNYQIPIKKFEIKSNI